MGTVVGHSTTGITYIIHSDGERGPIGHSDIGTHWVAGMRSQDARQGKKKLQMDSQTRVETTIFVSARASERRLGYGVVLGVEMVDDLVTGICALRDGH